VHHLLVSSAGPADVFGSSEIDEVEFADLADLVAVDRPLVHVHGHREDGVRPAIDFTKRYFGPDNFLSVNDG
jgi:hypothetical protein